MNHNSELKENIKTYQHLFSNVYKGIPKWVIAIYVRISKEEKKRKSVSKSIEHQIKTIAFEIEEDGEEQRIFINDYMIYDIYIDDGFSGTDFNRPDYQRLLKDIDNNIVNCIIVVDLSRYARNVVGALQGLEEFVFKTKVRFVTATDPFIDTFRDPKAISSDEVMDAVTQSEAHARITSKKIRRMQKVKMRNGEPVGGFPPYGYIFNPDEDEKNYIQDPYASQIIQKIFSWKADGFSNRMIAKMLNDDGVLNPTAYKIQVLKYNYNNPKKTSGLWCPTTISRILKDKTHLGKMVQGKTEVFDYLRHKPILQPEEKQYIKDNCHQSNVSPEIFQMVQQQSAQRTRISTKNGKIHIFSNLLCCETCGKAMHKDKTKTKEFFVCQTYKEQGKQYCSRKQVDYLHLENMVLKAIQKQIQLVCDMQSLVDEINNQPQKINESSRLNESLESYQTDLERTNRLFNDSYYDMKSGLISEEQYKNIRMETEQKLKQLRDIILKLSQQKDTISQGIKSDNPYFQTFLNYKNIESLDRQLLLHLVHKIYITEEKKIKIEFNFKDQYQLILDYIKENQKTRKKYK